MARNTSVTLGEHFDDFVLEKIKAGRLHRLTRLHFSYLPFESSVCSSSSRLNSSTAMSSICRFRGGYWISL